MKRRKFLLTGAATALWPLAAAAQKNEAARRIGILLPAVADDAQWQVRLGAFLKALAQLGWTADRNLRIDTRWGTTDAAEIRRQAAELAALAPEVILAVGASSTGPLLQATRTVPIVFTIVADPVASGFVDNLARPGGNATGFTSSDFSIGAKWLELIKEMAPGVTRVAVLRDASQGSAVSTFAAMQAVAPSLKVEVIPVNMRDAGEIERSVGTFARVPNGGLIPTPSAAAVRYRDLIVELADRHKLPAIYWDRFFVAAGGLMSYGPDLVDEFRQAAGHVDRILKGEKPADLPVQQSAKIELVINLKTAKALGLAVPQPLLARADEVIE
jgi:putative tryptophan/tyrosine transport system substrate-binding protein